MNPFLFHIVNFPLWLITLIPLRILYVFSDLASFFLFHILKYRNKVVFGNLKKAFPEKTPEEIYSIAKLFYHHLCDYFIESVYFLNISKRELSRRYIYKNIEFVNGYFEKNKSIIVALGHYGNWEWQCGSQMLTKYQVYGIYNPLNNNYFNELFLRIRERFGAKMLPMKTSYKDMVNDSKNNKQTVTYFLSDQRPVWSSIRYWTTFLNQETPVLLGTEQIAKKLHQPVFFLVITKVRRGYYEVEFELITDKPEETAEFEITEAHVRKLENIIRKKPEYWLWSHKRWKFKRSEIEKRQKHRND